MTLCPHAWPICGSASYSHITAIVGAPVAPASARNAVVEPVGAALHLEARLGERCR